MGSGRKVREHGKYVWEAVGGRVERNVRRWDKCSRDVRVFNFYDNFTNIYLRTIKSYILDRHIPTQDLACPANRVELISRQEDEIAFGFSGKGYFHGLPARSRRPKEHYSVVLAFKTLDEDALLFLTTNEQKVGTRLSSCGSKATLLINYLYDIKL